MPADRLLGTLLRSLQTFTEQQDTPRLLGTAASLLTTLTNPLNVTLLTSQLLSAPAIWLQVDSLQTCMRLLSVFHSAAQALIKHENAQRDKTSDDDFAQLQLERTLPKDDWIRAVINGADEHSPRWRHLLVFGGLLLGFGPVENEALSSSMRSTIETALVKATNLALHDVPDDDELGQESIALVLNHCFPLLSDLERSQVDYDALLPALMRSMLHSEEGLRSAYFLGVVDLDIQAASNTTFRWQERSASYQQIQRILGSPLVSSLGPLSRLIGHSIEQLKESWLVAGTLEDIESFARTLHLQWRQTKLSEVDTSEEGTYLDAETLEKTTPQLWKLLRSTLFAIVIVLRSVVGRIMADGALTNDEVAAQLATRALHTLRYLYFIASRTGSATFSQYTFVNLAALDILSAYPSQAEAFLRAIHPPQDQHAVPPHPLDRCLDLFYLNTSEHFTLVIPPQASEDLFIHPAAPYLAAGGNNNLLPIFEAAHSVMLAVFSAPQNAELTARHLPFYIESLFNVFPANLTARQFRLAFKTLARLASPPSLLAATQPFLAATLIELLRHRAESASADPIFPPEPSLTPDDASSSPSPPPPLSEQAVLTLTVIDTLTQVSLDLLEEWLPLTAEMLNAIEDTAMREHCREQFWRTLVGGEMDPNRSQVCHSWWSTMGGREVVLFGREDGYAARQHDEIVMSGGLGEGSSSKL